MPTPDLFSLDGQRLVLASDDFSARLWSAESGKPLGERLLHRAAILGSGFCLDGKRVFTASQDGSVRLADGSSGQDLGTLAKHGAALSGAVLDGTGRLLATLGDDRQVRLWALESGAAVGPALPHDGPVHQAAFSPDSALLLTACEDRLLRLWQVKTGKLLAAIEHPAAVLGAGFGGGGALAYSHAADQTVRVWDIASQRPLHDGIRHDGLLCVQMQADGSMLATGGRDKTARLWEAKSGETLTEPLGHEGPVLALCFSPDGQLLATASEDATARVWHTGSGKLAGEPLRHKQAVLALAFDRRGERVLTWSTDRAARLWEARSGKLLGQPMRLGSEPVDAGSGGTAERLDNATVVRLGGDRVVTVGGVTGLFTPITSGTDQPLGGDERQNLLAIIDQLKREVAEVQSRNLKLEADLAQLRQRPSAPDDFASGVQQSLDELQQRMGHMRNGTSNFAVREFKLDASVFVQVSPLGSIEYRFVQPGDKVDAASLSRIAMQVVPLPKDSLAGVWTPNLFQPDVPVSALPGITAESVRRLEAAGLYSIGEYLQVGTRARAQAHLEALLGVQRTSLALWAQQALLMTLRGLSGAAALVLIEAGLASFERLAAMLPAALQAGYEASRMARPDLGAPALDVALAAQWVRGARQYLGLPDMPETPDPPEPATPA
ncbi:MAG: DUF4332 domain-containing protein [Pseudomonadota bacterium]